MRNYLKIFLGLWLVVLTRCSLLEMSQTMWAKLLAGGLSKVGQLDPLKVPMVKVDQSEGNVNYRMILRNVEIAGLNDSRLESIQVVRGKLRSNLSELEAGYVTYTDLGDLESIRYKFHTVLNNPRKENDDDKVDTEGRGSNSSRSTENRFERRFENSGEAAYHRARFRDGRYQERSEETTTTEPRTDSTYMRNLKIEEKMESDRAADAISEYPSSVHVIYAQSSKLSEKNNREITDRERDEPDCPGGCRSREEGGTGSTVRESSSSSLSNRGGNRASAESVVRYLGQRTEDAYASASENEEVKLQGRSFERSSSALAVDRRTQSSVEGKIERASELADSPKIRVSSETEKLENKPGYIDIVYADRKNSSRVKHFGNTRLSVDQTETKVYGLDQVIKDIREDERILKHNFTQGEALSKRYDRARVALEARNLKGLPRYAENYQEKEGYFEEGMELIYHYGGMGNDSRNVKRIKRAHPENETEVDDVMHVIMQIRVPLLRVKSEYTLAGKVGEEILRGNGLLVGNFAELRGDFTVELKKGKEDSMTVRATRAKLTAKDSRIDLQGMDEEGPVKSILAQGLMAAEAVAAMLADDLATKALSEKTADAMVYRMYNNLPATN